MSNRKIIRFLLGGYLAYQSFQLYKNVFTVMETTRFKIVFFILATVFLAVAVLFLFSLLRDEYRKFMGLDQEETESLEEPSEIDTDLEEPTDTDTEITDSEE